MVKVDIYIDGQRLDLESGTNHSLTRQVNEFTELTTRQFDYTNKFAIPKTARNRKIFDFLSFPANTSNLPYRRIDKVRMSFNGIPVVNSGYAHVNSTDDNYNMVIYDGTVGFYDSIRNLTLDNLDWSDTNHTYNSSTMVSSWTGGFKYIYPYIQTNVNQKAGFSLFDQPAIGVYLKDVVQKISDISGYSITGSLLTDQQYLDSVVILPKSFQLDTDNTTLQATDSKNKSYTTEAAVRESDPPTINVPQDFYRLRVAWNYTTTTNTLPQITVQYDSGIIDVIQLSQDSGETIFFGYGTKFEAIMSAFNTQGVELTINITIEARKIDNNFAVRIQDYIGSTKLDVFLRNVLVQFGCNIYSDQKNTSVELAFINELENVEIRDLSNYFIDRTKESYQLGSYASKNVFKYGLEDGQDESYSGELLYSHNAGERKTHFTSIFFEPVFVDEVTNLYRSILFEGDETKEGKLRIGQIKDISRDVTVTLRGILGNDTVNTGQGVIVNGYKAFDFKAYRFSDILSKYYNYISNYIFNAPQKITVQLSLPVIIFQSISLKGQVYLSQENANFLVNKIKYNTRGRTTAELIKVSPKPFVISNPVAIITGDEFTFSGNSSHTFNLSGQTSYSPNSIITGYFWEVKNGAITISTHTTETISILVPEGETYEVCLTVTNEDGLTDQTCETLENISETVTSFGFENISTIESQGCYTLRQFEVVGLPNGIFNLRVRISVSVGTGRTAVFTTTNPGNNCVSENPATSGCVKLYDAESVGNVDIPVSLDGDGKVTMQIFSEGTAPSNLSIPCIKSVTIIDQDNGQTETLISRTWTKTNKCSYNYLDQ